MDCRINFFFLCSEDVVEIKNKPNLYTEKKEPCINWCLNLHSDVV